MLAKKERFMAVTADSPTVETLEPTGSKKASSSTNQTKFCNLCSAKFTRTTHLNRHMNSHTNEKLHRCKACQAEFTRSDLLARHKRTCGGSALANKSRRKSCQACAESKIKCDIKQPCSKCVSRGKDCVFLNDPIDTRARMENPRRRRRKPKSGNVEASKRPKGSLVASAVTRNESPLSSSASSNSNTNSIPLSPQSPFDSPPLHSHNVDSNTPSSSPSSCSPASACTGPSDLSALQMDSLVGNLSLVTAHSSSSAAIEQSLPMSLDNAQLNPILHANPFDFVGQPFFDSEELTATNGHTSPSFWDSVTTDAKPSSLSLDMDQQLNRFPNTCTNQLLPPQPLSGVELDILGLPLQNGMDIDVPTQADLQLYLQLFYTAFLKHVPMLNPHVFDLRSKLRIVQDVVYACGALFYQQHDVKASKYVDKALKEFYGVLGAEFGHRIDNPAENTTVISLIIAVSLLQHLGFHSHEASHRECANLYHGMLVMMIKRAGLFSKASSWSPPDLSADSGNLESVWAEWADYEMIKRCLFGVFVHDCCQSIYFSLTPSLQLSDFDFPIPCDDTLWRASSAEEWFTILQTPGSPYGTGRTRMCGVDFQVALSSVMELQSQPGTPGGSGGSTQALNSGAYFILIHALLRSLYTSSLFQSSPQERLNKIFSMQFALHNWLRQWLDNEECIMLERDAVDAPAKGEMRLGGDPPYWINVLPFYWLAQVTLFAIQEGKPFAGAKFFHRSAEGEEGDGGNLDKLEEMKAWVDRIRGILRTGGTIPVELMQVQPNSLKS